MRVDRAMAVWISGPPAHRLPDRETLVTKRRMLDTARGVALKISTITEMSTIIETRFDRQT
jgi:hypothetical protein